MNMHKKLKLVSMASFFLLAMMLTMSSSSLVAVTASPDKVNDALADIKARGTLKVGADTAYPPFESINEATSKAEGFDVDIAGEIASALGVNLTVITSAWDPIIPNLQAGDFDMIISAMTITPERELEVDFSRWYYNSTQAILVTTANPKNIDHTDDLNVTGIKIGLQSGTTSDWYADDNLQAATVQKYSDFPLAVAALKKGELDAVLGDYPVLFKDASESGETKVVFQFSQEFFGIAVRTGETALLNAVNDVLDELLGTDVDNPVFSQKYADFHEKWFKAKPVGYTAPSVPGFEIPAMLAIAAIPIVRKLRRN